MSTYKIKCFSQYVLRTPLFPVSFYLNLIDNYSQETLLQVLENPLVKEAIRIASPELVLALDKWKKNSSNLSNKKEIGLEITLLKYLARMSARCTPFGLFAGCTTGKIDSETNIILKSPASFIRYTQFDMQFWLEMLQEIGRRKEVVNHLKYYPNTSIYALGDFYRYVEYKYVKTKREHSISALRKSSLLETVLLHAKSGMTVDEMTLFLIDNPSEKEDALGFIYELINFQFLVSEIDGTITGKEEWKRVSTIFNKIPELQDDCKQLQDIKKKLLKLDVNLVPPEVIYAEIKIVIQKMNLHYDEKYLFQTDLNTATYVNGLSRQIPKKVMQAVRFLNGIQGKKESVNQSNFVKAFIQRYESREMPLTTVLDTETGIGYLQNSEMNDVHEILERFSFEKTIAKKKNESWSDFDYILEKKMQECILKKEKSISLFEKDFPDFESNWNNAPATFSVMIEVLKNEEISIASSGNVSAAKLLGRFCNGNRSIHNLTKEIIERESDYYSDKILAEVVHIPESRTGNILRRPILREYEIAYLSIPGVSESQVIDLNDLMIAIKGNKIILRSKKYNKEVIPCLSNAHDYSNNSLPIYHFLCDLQSQNLKPIYSFNWGVLDLHYNFFPRVLYKDVILSKAKWTVYKNEIDQFLKIDSSKLLETFTIWKNQRNIPKLVNWVNSDNTLLLDLEKEICIQLFLKSVQNYSKIILEEFLFSNNSIVKDANSEDFSNQFILSFYKEQIVSEKKDVENADKMDSLWRKHG
ncbi:lantibiotic dehydratase family protein [Flavobacterium sp. LS1R49]|uniref:Lantibiotic dehydratase family protein n=1 Tax=Flavobacterium shii TaxID=2987687 RepID=A0A9X2ZKF7_9FLAO|nr:lantibiotic dehydratase family protein [Flavobacterium shii]MCV9930456.1 lantibiotic dehydratase family protein [Flavobacterium shii]